MMVIGLYTGQKLTQQTEKAPKFYLVLNFDQY